MSWRLCWSEPALRSILDIPWRDAARVDAAIMAFAERGVGQVVRLRDDDAVTVRLRVGAFSVRISLNRLDGTMTIWSVYRPSEPKGR